LMLKRCWISRKSTELNIGTKVQVVTRRNRSGALTFLL
jgi:hypothetical protein